MGDLPGHEFRGNQWTSSSGGSDSSSATVSRGDWQETHPPFVFGGQHHPSEIGDYLAKAGATMKSGSKLPPDVERGTPKQCYLNATQTIIGNDDYDYAEGIAYANGLPFLHGWAVDRKTGAVVDPTWDNPEKCRYYGVRYDREKYLAHIMKTKMYGVLGGAVPAATKVMKRGGL